MQDGCMKPPCSAVFTTLCGHGTNSTILGLFADLPRFHLWRSLWRSVSIPLVVTSIREFFFVPLGFVPLGFGSLNHGICPSIRVFRT